MFLGRQDQNGGEERGPGCFSTILESAKRTGMALDPREVPTSPGGAWGQIIRACEPHGIRQ